MQNRMVLLTAALMVLLTGAAVAVVLILAGGESRTVAATPTKSVELVEATVTLATPSGTTPPSEEWIGRFQISPQESEVRFVIGEILRGQEAIVVGTTSQVSGQLEIDRRDPANSSIGVIQIEADSFVTDSSLRDRAIDNFILNSSQFPLIEFEPQRIVDMPAEVQVNDPVSFQVEGLLTIRDVTQTVTFTVEAILMEGPRLRGSARTTIDRSDFNLTIPSVPQVAGVDEQIKLEFDFIALPLLGS